MDDVPIDWAVKLNMVDRPYFPCMAWTKPLKKCDTMVSTFQEGWGYSIKVCKGQDSLICGGLKGSKIMYWFDMLQNNWELLNLCPI